MKPSVLELRQLARRCSNGDTAALDELNLYSDNPSPVQSEALYLLGTLYDQNEAIPRLPINLELARSYYLLAAQQGHAMSQYCLGNMYDYGDGGKRNLEEARRFYGQAAAQGIRDAQMHYARMLQTGRGGCRDIEEAALWYMKAVDQGDELAAMNLGEIHLREELSDSSAEFALKLFTFASSRMLGSAYLQLGHLYRTGIAVERSIELALFHYCIAVELGQPGPWLDEAIKWKENFLSYLPSAARDHYDSVAHDFIKERRGAIH
jgi:TPR repeat protein